MLFASAVPLAPGKADRYRQVAAELGPHLDEYEALNVRYGIDRHAYWVNHARTGIDIGVSIYDISPDGLESMRFRQWDPDSAHDRWWLEFVRDVNGIDLLDETAHAARPEQLHTWER